MVFVLFLHCSISHVFIIVFIQISQQPFSLGICIIWLAKSHEFEMENAFLPTATHVHALSSITFPKHNNMYASLRCAFQRLQYFTGKKTIHLKTMEVRDTQTIWTQPRPNSRWGTYHWTYHWSEPY